MATLRQRTEAAPVALVHDYLTQRGGAERVVAVMMEAFSAAPLYTSLYAAETTFPEFVGRDIRPLGLNRVPLLRRDHRLAFPLLAPAFSSCFIDAEITVCSSSGWAHGVRTSGRKLVYCHAPARWLYQGDRYLGDPARQASNDDMPHWARQLRQRSARTALRALETPLRRWDRWAAASADRYLANSVVTATAIKQIYGIDAEVLPPPPGLTPDGEMTPVPGIEPGYFLCVSRLLPYKNVEAIVKAFSRLSSSRLVVVGGGPLLESLQASAPPNVQFAGIISDAQLRWLYSNSFALVAASYEDYGLTPLEAGSFGRPSVVLRAGGFLDTVQEGVNGLFFKEPSVDAVAKGIEAATYLRWDTPAILAHARSFSKEPFIERVQGIVREMLYGASKESQAA